MAHVKSVLATSFAAFAAIFAWSPFSAAQGEFPAPAGAPAPAAPAAAPAPAATATATVGTGGATATATGPATDYCNPATNATPDLGCQGTFVIDQVSGFRGRVGGGVSYYGPLGIAYNTFSAPSGQVINFSPGGTATISQSETTIKSWSIWLSPSIDYFIVPNLSVGGLFSVDTTFGSAETKITTQSSGGGSTVKTQQNDLPSVTSFTLIPRLGYLLRVNDRLSFWPRVGLGYFSGSNVSVQPSGDSSGAISNVTRETNIRSLIVQIDVGVVYQITDNVFFRAAPAVTFSSGGSSTVKYKNGATPDSEGSGSAFQFEITSGFGANFSL